MVTAGLSPKQIIEAHLSPERTARLAKLKYVSADDKGIRRLKKGKAFVYYDGKRKIDSPAVIERIKKLAIPPAWTNVWISSNPDGHIQATGLDAKKRKQYRYHPNWNEARNETKFFKLLEVGKSLPALRKKIKKDIKNKDLTADKVLATAIRLMEQTYIRVGNNSYEKMNGSYGLTTLKNKHVNISQDKIKFCFVGKKGIEHEIELKDKQLARIVKQCRKMPGKELFQYYDEKGERKSIDSGMVNNYIREATGKDITAKDLRTWAGCIRALECLTKLGAADTEKKKKENIQEMLETVSKKLGNTKTVCKKYYIHPGLIRLYEEDKLISCLENSKSRTRGLSIEECQLMCLLKTQLK